MLIPYSRQQIEADDISEDSRVLKSDFLTTGPEIELFEKALAESVNARFAVVCSSGTAALHLTTLVLGLGPQDTIVTSPITFLATANCARYVGAEVLFSDVDEKTINLSPSILEKVIRSSSQKISAIYVVHFAGQPADMESIFDISQQYKIPVVEDASHALGATYTLKNGETIQVGNNRHAVMAVFSFHPVKHVAAGEGGAVTTNDENLYERLKRFRNHGMKHDASQGVWFYEMSELGYNYRLSDIQAALARNQLKKLPASLKRRHEIANEYQERIEEIFGELVRPVDIRSNVYHAYHLYPVSISFELLNITRDQVMRRLREEGIGTQVNYIPVHTQPYYQKRYGTNFGDFPNAEKYYAEALSLPMYAGLPPNGVQRVVQALEEVLNGRPSKKGK